MISTKGGFVVCNGRRDGTSDLSPCNHEENDTRLILHAANAAMCGFQRVMLRTVETDVTLWYFHDALLHNRAILSFRLTDLIQHMQRSNFRGVNC